MEQRQTVNMPKKIGNKPHLRAKINDKCRSCIYDRHAQGSWRKQTENCTSYTCPLFDVRPVTTGGLNHV